MTTGQPADESPKHSGGAHVPRFFVETRLEQSALIQLNGEQSQHLAKVLRANAGDPAILFDGSGGEWLGHVQSISKNTVTVALASHNPDTRESSLTLTLAQGIARGDRMDQAVAKAVELGVDIIQPLFSARGKVRLQGARLEKKIQHWQRVARSAAEQSARTTLPLVRPALAINTWLPQAGPGQKLVLDPTAQHSLGDCEQAQAVTLLVGPESGLLNSEVAQAEAHGFQRLYFGPRILRTETAGPACLAAIQTLWGDLG